MKRCIIELPKIRISKPGFDVDTAAPENLLFHEDFLFAQPYFFGFVACPFAGYIGNGSRDQTASVTVPDVTADPVVLLFMSATSSADAIYPMSRDKGTGSDQNGYNVDSWLVMHQVISSTQIDVRFVKDSQGRKSPAGAHMILLRKGA